MGVCRLRDAPGVHIPGASCPCVAARCGRLVALFPPSSVLRFLCPFSFWMFLTGVSVSWCFQCFLSLNNIIKHQPKNTQQQQPQNKGVSVSLQPQREGACVKADLRTRPPRRPAEPKTADAGRFGLVAQPGSRRPTAQPRPGDLRLDLSREIGEGSFPLLIWLWVKIFNHHGTTGLIHASIYQAFPFMAGFFNPRINGNHHFQVAMFKRVV